MNVISITYIISAFISFESAFTVFRLNRRSNVNIVYALFSVVFLLEMIFLNQYLTAPSRESAIFWAQLAVPLFIVHPALIIHFFLCLTGQLKPVLMKPFIFFLYALSILLIELNRRNVFIADHIMTAWGWDFVYYRDSVWFLIPKIYAVVFPLSCLLILAAWYKKSRTPIERKQARVMIISFIPGYIGIMSCFIFLFTDNEFYFTLVSNLEYSLFFTIFILGVRYAILKYKLMTFSIETPVIDIIAGFNDPALLVLPTGEIIYRNQLAESIIGSAGGGKMPKVYNVFSCGGDIIKEIEKMLSGDYGTHEIDCVQSAMEGQELLTLDLKGVKNELDQLTGIIMIMRKKKRPDDFIIRYGITGRQADIVSLVVSGFSNREIAGQLKLSERTVENHLFNIYNKTAVSNRVELVNLAMQYK